MKKSRSSKNVFSDLGFDGIEAENLRVRAELIIELDRYIKDRGFTQAEAATQLGVSQPRISNLLHGRIDLFSIDKLIEMLSRIGIKVKIRIHRPRAA